MPICIGPTAVLHHFQAIDQAYPAELLDPDTSQQIAIMTANNMRAIVNSSKFVQRACAVSALD